MDSFLTDRQHRGIILPPALEKGDRIAIISPASAVKEEFVEGAMEKIAGRGYEPVLMPFALGNVSGSYSAPKGDRLIDLYDALEDDDIKAVLCSRGGYGCVHLLPHLSRSAVTSNPKWIIGFSDVSALLSMMYQSNIASVHGPMAKHLATMPADDACTSALFNILESGGEFDYSFPGDSRNRPGKVSGVLKGGNLAVLNDLAGTPFDMLSSRRNEDVILFLEDISEPIYAVERMLMRLYLSGELDNVRGVIFGQFTEYKPDKNFHSMEEMLENLTRLPLFPKVPVAFNFPVGHIDRNFPLVVGVDVELDITSENVTLKTI